MSFMVPAKTLLEIETKSILSLEFSLNILFYNKENYTIFFLFKDHQTTTSN